MNFFVNPDTFFSSYILLKNLKSSLNDSSESHFDVPKAMPPEVSSKISKLLDDFFDIYLKCTKIGYDYSIFSIIDVYKNFMYKMSNADETFKTFYLAETLEELNDLDRTLKELDGENEEAVEGLDVEGLYYDSGELERKACIEMGKKKYNGSGTLSDEELEELGAKEFYDLSLDEQAAALKEYYVRDRYYKILDEFQYLDLVDPVYNTSYSDTAIFGNPDGQSSNLFSNLLNSGDLSNIQSIIGNATYHNYVSSLYNYVAYNDIDSTYYDVNDATSITESYLASMFLNDQENIEKYWLYNVSHAKLNDCNAVAQKLNDAYKMSDEELENLGISIEELETLYEKLDKERDFYQSRINHLNGVYAPNPGDFGANLWMTAVGLVDGFVGAAENILDLAVNLVAVTATPLLFASDLIFSTDLTGAVWDGVSNYIAYDISGSLAEGLASIGDAEERAGDAFKRDGFMYGFATDVGEYYFYNLTGGYLSAFGEAAGWSDKAIKLGKSAIKALGSGGAELEENYQQYYKLLNDNDPENDLTLFGLTTEAYAHGVIKLGTNYFVVSNPDSSTLINYVSKVAEVPINATLDTVLLGEEWDGEEVLSETFAVATVEAVKIAGNYIGVSNFKTGKGPVDIFISEVKDEIMPDIYGEIHDVSHDMGYSVVHGLIDTAVEPFRIESDLVLNNEVYGPDSASSDTTDFLGGIDDSNSENL